MKEPRKILKADYQLLDKELEKNGFLSGLLNAVAEAQAVEKNATKIPQDHKKKN